MKFKFDPVYFGWSVGLFVIEVLIALYARDAFVRPYLGDFLCVILLYCILKSILKLDVWRTATGVLLFSYIIETLQYFHYVEVLGLSDHKWANILMGTYFTWVDILVYTLGIASVIIIEALREVLKKSQGVVSHKL